MNFSSLFFVREAEKLSGTAMLSPQPAMRIQARLAGRELFVFGLVERNRIDRKGKYPS
ncbi:hypothetical protein T458_11515 [Brevibacillus panacihumi W25]|uniref:Uncharacterized protein n=1 Tax=Brevibacillus panacihumi W25 TaxID=1408254 RepID=V6M7I5_9BACL|nr:hypothetical protein T458_11515 [Brevibacillus panacihumi W25]